MKRRERAHLPAKHCVQSFLLDPSHPFLLLISYLILSLFLPCTTMASALCCALTDSHALNPAVYSGSGGGQTKTVLLPSLPFHFQPRGWKSCSDDRNKWVCISFNFGTLIFFLNTTHKPALQPWGKAPQLTPEIPRNLGPGGSCL